MKSLQSVEARKRGLEEGVDRPLQRLRTGQTISRHLATTSQRQGVTTSCPTFQHQEATTSCPHPSCQTHQPPTAPASFLAIRLGGQGTALELRLPISTISMMYLQTKSLTDLEADEHPSSVHLVHASRPFPLDLVTPLVSTQTEALYHHSLSRALMINGQR